MKDWRTTHGKSKSKIYKVWVAMIQRCYNPYNDSFKRYGGRGIKVCIRWQDFALFLEDMGEPSPGLTLERVKNNEGYYKENCIWATRKIQASNTRTRLQRSLPAGVRYFPGGKWRVCIWNGEKELNLGTFSNLLDAAAAQISAENFKLIRQENTNAGKSNSNSGAIQQTSGAKV